MDIGILRTSTLPQLIAEAAKVVYIGLKIPATLRQVITDFMDVGQIWPATITLVIAEDMLIELDLGH